MRSTLTRTLVDAATLATDMTDFIAKSTENRREIEQDLAAIDERLQTLVPALKKANPARRKVLRPQLLSLVRRKKLLISRLELIDQTTANVRVLADHMGLDIDPSLEIGPEELAPSALETVIIEDSDAEFAIPDLTAEINQLIDDLRAETIGESQEEEFADEFEVLEEIIGTRVVSLEGIRIGADG
jgi:hypothetical protein